MRLSILPAAALLGLAACTGGGGTSTTRNDLSICSDPASPPAEAMRFCQRALEDPRLDARQRALVQMNIGIAAFALGRNREAIAAHTQALALAPGLTGALTGRAEVYEAQGDTRAALADYAAAITATPAAPEPWFAR
ncbi:MAG: tetratricopeptide repeat protein, partial [Thermohalobaculum sp.]|nr:tetratricopeptide repeat protein [Thermohalobaculum sp.]